MSEPSFPTESFELAAKKQYAKAVIGNGHLCKELVTIQSLMTRGEIWSHSYSVVVTLALHSEGGHDIISFDLAPWIIGDQNIIHWQSFKEMIYRRLEKYFPPGMTERYEIMEVLSRQIEHQIQVAGIELY